MNQTIEAVFEDGIFKPLEVVSNEIKDGDKVKIVIKSVEHIEESIVDPTEKYFKGLSEDDIEQVITHALEDLK